MTVSRRREARSGSIRIPNTDVCAAIGTVDVGLAQHFVEVAHGGVTAAAVRAVVASLVSCQIWADAVGVVQRAAGAGRTVLVGDWLVAVLAVVARGLGGVVDAEEKHDATGAVVGMCTVGVGFAVAAPDAIFAKGLAAQLGCNRVSRDWHGCLQYVSNNRLKAHYGTSWLDCANIAL